MHTMAHEYNRWLHEYCSESPTRLIGVGLAALQDPALAVKEMERCVQDLGFKAMMIRPAPVHREQEAERPGLRPVLGRRRAARLPDRRPPVLVRRHAVERRDPPRAAGRLVRPGRQGPRAPAGPRERARRDGGDGMVRRRRHLRALPRADRRLPRGFRRLVRADARALRPPRRRLRQPLPDDAAVGGLQAAVLHQLRPRRGGARLHRQQQVRRRRPHRVGVGLSAPRRQDPRHRARAGRGHRGRSSTSSAA